jgi:hypothetical protein
MQAGDFTRYLSQGAQKPVEVCTPPPSRVSKLATIEIQQPGLVIGVDQQIVSSQIGVKGAGIVKLPDALTDSLPGFCG